MTNPEISPEFNDPERLLDSDPERMVATLLLAEIEALRKVIENHSKISKLMYDKRVLDLLPENMKTNPVVMAQLIASFKALGDSLSGFHLSVLSVASILMPKTEIDKLLKYYK